MFVRRRALAALIGMALLSGTGGCHPGHGRAVILLPRRHQPAAERHSDIDTPGPNGGYRPVGEYPVPAPPAATEGDGPSLQQTPMSPSAGAAANSHSDNQIRNASEPAATQRMLLSEAQPKVVWWQRIGNGFQTAFGMTQGYRTVGTSAIYEARAAGGQLAKKTADVFKKPSAPPKTEPLVSEIVEREPIRLEPAFKDRNLPGENDFEAVASWYDHPACENAAQIGAKSPAKSSSDSERLRTADEGPRLLQ